MARLAGWWTTIALLVAGTAFCVPLVDGYFLADDFVQLANFAHWESRGTLANQVLARFGGSIDEVNGFWRPLTYATYALNYLASGADARAWLAVNLILHVANAALVAALVRRLHPEGGTRPAAFAAIFFFAFAPGWEAVLWIACRYDTLSTLFTLLAAWWFAGGATRKALAATVLALMAKESGSVAFVLVGSIALAREIALSTPARLLVRRLAASLGPFVLLGLAYIALRYALFGSATQAYVGVSIDMTTSQYWADLAHSGLAWGRVNFPGPPGLRPLAALAVVVILVAGALPANRSREARASLLAVLFSLAAALFLVLRFTPQFDPGGLGGRLYYLPGALFALALGIALGRILEPAASGLRRRIAAQVIAGLLVAASVHWMWRAADDYRGFHREMKAVVAAVAQVAAGSPDPPALLLVPDMLGRAAFGRNAQAGLMLPPVQRGELSHRILVQTDKEISAIPQKIAGGLFDWLSRNSIFNHPAGDAPLPGTRPTPPSSTLCWSSREHRFSPLRAPEGESAWDQKTLEAAYAAACG